jgi:sortase A
MQPPPRRLLALACVALSLLLAADAGWIHAKAWLAQALLDRAWQRTLTDGGVQRPWPWADTRPVARLSTPRLRRDQIVLAGDNGRTLAFGPGWAEASAAPGTRGTTVVSGHRDTHFAWLAELAPGDVVSLDGGNGAVDYVVTGTRVADSRHERLVLDGDRDGLRLVTCWPFDAVVTGGPLRYVVSARPARDVVAAQGASVGTSKPSANSTSATSAAGSRTMS